MKAAKDELRLNVSIHKCKWAKKIVMSELDASYKVQFGHLAAYADALKRTNPGTTAEINLCKDSLREGKRIFRRMCICFDALKKGWKGGCRPLIGLDGCFNLG